VRICVVGRGGAEYLDMEAELSGSDVSADEADHEEVAESVYVRVASPHHFDAVPVSTSQR
jgi:hypothetical protein